MNSRAGGEAGFVDTRRPASGRHCNSVGGKVQILGGAHSQEGLDSFGGSGRGSGAPFRAASIGFRTPYPFEAGIEWGVLLNPDRHRCILERLSINTHIKSAHGMLDFGKAI